MIFRYTMYWVVLLISKLAFSFYAEVLHLALILNVFFLNITRTICKYVRSILKMKTIFTNRH